MLKFRIWFIWLLFPFLVSSPPIHKSPPLQPLCFMVFPFLSLTMNTAVDEESGISMISNTAGVVREGSDSDDTSAPSAPPTKRQRQETAAAPAPSARFKGVVVQQNGHWGAQIYADHRRIWLGTFKSEESAAVAYDRAAIKLRHDDPHRNFSWTELTAYEPVFQHLFTTDAVLKMIRDGSYDAKFSEFVHATGCDNVDGSGAACVGDNQVAGDIAGVVFHELFQKELTPSDVGKLNRLVIPKKHAVRYFPPIQGSDKGGGDGEGDGAEGMMLEFRDRQGRRWDFRYCYWRSSQSFVFTKGWNKFVKTKGLSAKDTVVFYRCEDRVGGGGRPFCTIDVEHTSRAELEGRGDEGSRWNLAAGKAAELEKPGCSMVRLELGLGCLGRREEEGMAAEEEGEVVMEPAEVREGEHVGVWLFGVQIS